MNFARPKPRRLSEPALPMINVVFLLLIFFLMSARIAPPAPFAVAPPEAVAEGEAHGEHTLHIGADGLLAFDAAREDGVWAALGGIETPETATLLIRADASLPANRLAEVLSRASQIGFGEIRLVTAKR